MAVRRDKKNQKAGSQIAAEISVLWMNLFTVMSVLLGDLLTVLLLTSVTAVVVSNSSVDVGVTTGKTETVMTNVNSRSVTCVASSGGE